MMKITRRRFVQAASATGAALMLTGATGCSDDDGNDTDAGLGTGSSIQFLYVGNREDSVDAYIGSTYVATVASETASAVYDISPGSREVTFVEDGADPRDEMSILATLPIEVPTARKFVVYLSDGEDGAAMNVAALDLRMPDLNELDAGTSAEVYMVAATTGPEVGKLAVGGDLSVFPVLAQGERFGPATLETGTELGLSYVLESGCSGRNTYAYEFEFQGEYVLFAAGNPIRNEPVSLFVLRPDSTLVDLSLTVAPFASYEYDGPDGPSDMFQHGVASGDPLCHQVILWTRVTQELVEAVDVYWEIATDPELQSIVNAGYAPLADASRNFTVKVDADGLQPSTTYYYRFRAMNRVSPVGRTKTSPATGEPIDLARVAMCSCSSLASGYFHAYRALSEQLDLDVVVHLGDYLYENGGGSVRSHEPSREIISLEDYRMRHAQYRRDPDLQAAHQQHPFIVVWDDHESANDSFEDGAENHSPETEGAWQARKDAAVQAYSEWMPIRDQDDIAKIWRKFEYGNLFDLLMLDTRLWGRDKQDLNGRTDSDRTILGDDQAQWLEQNLTESDATWKILGQQVMFGQLLLGEGDAVVNEDQWDGYQASRDRVFDTIESNNIDNVIVLTGDIHTAWAMDLSRDPQNPDVYDAETGRGSLAVEFVTTSVTSSSLEALSGLGSLIDGLFADFDPHIKYYELVQKGFAVLDIRPDRVQTDFYYVGDVKLPSNDRLDVEGSYSVAAGSQHVVAANAPVEPSANPPAPAPQGGNELIAAAAVVPGMLAAE